MDSQQFLTESRIKVYIDVDPKKPLKYSLPIIYDNDTSGITAYNSGGRSVIFNHPYDDKCYKIKGVDPDGELTTDVCFSDKSTRDIDIAANMLAGQKLKKLIGLQKELKFIEGTPFGVMTKENCKNSKRSFEKINSWWNLYGIKPPLKCNKHVAINKEEDKYQMIFEIPSLESDLRISDFTNLLTRKILETKNYFEDPRKFKTIKFIYGFAFQFWSGLNAKVLQWSNLIPHPNSHEEQNYVLYEFSKGKYAPFRIDMSSTQERTNKLVVNIKNLRHLFVGLPQRAYIFNHPELIPESIRDNNQYLSSDIFTKYGSRELPIKSSEKTYEEYCKLNGFMTYMLVEGLKTKKPKNLHFLNPLNRWKFPSINENLLEILFPEIKTT